MIICEGWKKNEKQTRTDEEKELIQMSRQARWLRPILEIEHYYDHLLCCVIACYIWNLVKIFWKSFEMEHCLPKSK